MMKILDKIQDDLPELSKANQRVAKLLISAPNKFMNWPTKEIAAEAGVSEPTVTRFCRHYGYKGIPDFRIALAISLAASTTSGNRVFLEPNVTDKAFVHRNQKLAIAKKALELITEDRSIILDSGSSIQLFAHTLRKVSGRTIVTTGLNIVETLWGCTQHTIIMPGGTIRFEARALTGLLVESTLKTMRFDTVYFGADSVDLRSGLSTFNEEEARQNAAMMAVSQRVVVLVDSSKFRAPMLHQFCDFKQIDTIVTDDNIPPEIAQEIREAGVNLLIADTNESKI